MEELIYQTVKYLSSGESMENIHDHYIDCGESEENIFLAIKAAELLLKTIIESDEVVKNTKTPFGRKK